ncbi:MAG: DUF819 family protein [Bacteroidetes bacterium]|nr:DUF819 family protein [Bacteroidota bacterium]
MAATQGIAFLLILILPAALQILCRRGPLAVLGPAVLCYLAGMGMGALELRLPAAQTETLVGVSVLLALPLLLFTADVRSWLRFSRDTWLAFGLAVVATMAAAAVAGRFSAHPVAHHWAAMLTAVYVGGTPNLAAVGWSLGTPSEHITLMHTTDAACSAVYILFMMRLARPLLRHLLPAKDLRAADALPAQRAPLPPLLSLQSAVALGLGLLVAVLSYGGALGLLAVWPDPAVAVDRGGYLFAMLVSLAGLLGLALSLVPRVRTLRASEPLGEYAVLVFCVAFGSLTDIRVLLASSTDALLFTAGVLTGTVVLYYLLCMLLRIDRDTAIIVSCATTQGPAFVSPVAQALKNPQLLVPGIAAGLAGYAAGTWAGLLLYRLL